MNIQAGTKNATCPKMISAVVLKVSSDCIASIKFSAAYIDSKSTSASIAVQKISDTGAFVNLAAANAINMITAPMISTIADPGILSSNKASEDCWKKVKDTVRQATTSAAASKSRMPQGTLLSGVELFNVN